MNICMLIFADYSTDVRIDKEIKTLTENGYNCFVLSYGKEESIDNFSKKIILKRKNKISKIFEFIFKAFSILKEEKVDVIHAHDFLALPIAYILAKRLNVKVIFDAHELYHEFHNFKKIKKLIFKIVLPKIYHTFTVSPSISKIYSKQFNLQNISVLKNTPNYPKYTQTSENNLKTSLQIHPEKKVLLFQGYIVPGRGIEKLIKTLKYLKENYVLVLMGHVEDDYKNQLNNLINNLNLSNRIYFKNAVKYDEIPIYTSGADLGIFLHQNESLNHYYCLPNKIFEFITSKLPILVVDFPDLKEVVLKNGFGEVVDEFATEEAVANKIKYMFDNYSLYKKNLEEKYLYYYWEKDEKYLLNVYKKLVNFN